MTIYQKRGDEVVPVFEEGWPSDDAPDYVYPNASDVAGYAVPLYGEAQVEGSKRFVGSEGLLSVHGFIGAAFDVACGATTSLDPHASVNRLTVNRNTTITIPGISFTGSDSTLVCVTTLVFSVSASTYTLTWGSNIKWANSTPPELEAPTGTHVITFITYDNGATWIGTPSALNVG